MNNTIKLFLFNILLCSAPAVQAMGMLHTIGKFKFGKYVAHAQKKDISNSIEKNLSRLETLQKCPAMRTSFGMFRCAIPSRQMSKQLLPIFEKIKQKLENTDNVALIAGSFPVYIAASWNCPCCNHKLVLVDHHFCNTFSTAVQQFVLAHELVHAAKDHVKKIKELRTLTAEEKSMIMHECEYEADAEAVRALGTAQGAFEFFAATNDKHGNGATHPSHENRVKKLLALQNK